MIKTLPLEENPREKVKSEGIEKLSNAELIALIIHTGTKNESVLELSNRILLEMGNISELQNMSLNDLLSIKGIGEAKAITLLSIVELSKRLKSNVLPTMKIKEPEHVYRYVKDEMMFLKQEHFVLLCLDNRCRVINKKTIFIGTINASYVQPREVYKEALKVNATSIVIIHNHPSGDCTPSQDDLKTTLKFMEVGEIIGIHLVDHIVIGWDCYCSIMSQYREYLTNYI